MKVEPALDPLDIRFGFTPGEAYAYLLALGENGRQVYWWTELLADSLYPIVYTASSVLLISCFFERLFPVGSIWRKLNLLPLMVMLADYLENIGILTMLSGFPAQNEGIAQLASIANLVKWGLFPALIMLIMIGMGGWLYSKLGRIGTRL
ncbi:hypothetical protein [Telluribacter humicola]|uniref:hypothetical protein n=1 Tax=Telluribacter humicola TaxID=1720261 RepID=UPI001A95DAB0|nr:hypothetical protein [Telluribacter humicola]